ncbi:uncharacterized protein LOC143178997 [Calliopsis andreniformis]|uniref:uncharacterized protein LOC143178997 n=1 Tax=Calliopsis andreniformis TaxID=337506 RepID=UPI003FCD720D
MAALLLTRYWGSDESLNYLGEISSKERLTPLESPQKEKITLTEPTSPQNQTNSSKQPLKRRSLNATSKVTNSKVNKNYRNIILESSNVRASALLYEITERTNQLAQPRLREAEMKWQPRSIASQIPKATPRIIELSRPRMIYQQPSKPIGYVSRSALTAVATQRIIELSRPKKKRRVKMSKRRRTDKGKSRCHMRQTKKGSNLDHDSFLQGKSDRRIKRKRITKRKQYSPRSSNSNRTIIMVDLSPRNSSRAKSKRARHS